MNSDNNHSNGRRGYLQVRKNTATWSIDMKLAKNKLITHRHTHYYIHYSGRHTDFAPGMALAVDKDAHEDRTEVRIRTCTPS
ncbi:MAG: hypothetical protein QX198_17500 [Methylococcaceae bacterium]